MGFKRAKLQERCEMSEAVFGHEGLSESLMTTFLQNFLCMFPNRCPPPPPPLPKTTQRHRAPAPVCRFHIQNSNHE